MIYRYPDYYRDFRCIAGDCRDNCCKGWEIDIDSDTADYYAAVKGSFGERLRSSIKNGSFVLTADQRCPFLNSSGLCDIYTELGGDKLCKICSDHPRFYEWFGSFKEGGIGLCCEAAAELILSRPFLLREEEAPPEDAAGEYDEELLSMLLRARDEMFAALEREDIPLWEALCRILDIAAEIQDCLDMPFPDSSAELPCSGTLGSFFACLSELEPIDESWQPYISACAEKLSSAAPHESGQDILLRRLGAYFIYRYLLKSVYDGQVLGYAKFAVFSLIIIDRLCRLAEEGCTADRCAGIAKNYSKETEYCEENMAELLERFGQEPCFGTLSLKSLIAASFPENVDGN
ncbi:flagellin lysine-N-methylase [uncultured Ruminococcus sp.]|uniref:flagellin lysine-N-methylase n=1 Tax=uncultured Ruminococcus sp. TaxID=165186 RepID=UPI00262DB97B|nr:flagellin lysine-N-methylase [uncultured Ruminococcus sp.]